MTNLVSQSISLICLNLELDLPLVCLLHSTKDGYSVIAINIVTSFFMFSLFMFCVRVVG